MSEELMNGWNEKYAAAESNGEREKRIIREWFPRAINVVKTGSGIDRAGVDYICELDRGAVVCIDAKTRVPGCSKYWTEGPELAVETSSVVEKKIAGWTLSSSTQCDYVLYTFSPEDCGMSFLIPFQALRRALFTHYKEWMDKYKPKRQRSCGHGGEWTSECLFIPASVVMNAIHEQMSIEPTGNERRDTAQRRQP